mmetsp:Transcript_11694/g.23994  ORF Transcript_11694/g.23994 Transcript_11694/m.23994 type:complete len:248 (-) Transcript_11694:60-803(-)
MLTKSLHYFFFPADHLLVSDLPIVHTRRVGDHSKVRCLLASSEARRLVNRHHRYQIRLCHHYTLPRRILFRNHRRLIDHRRLMDIQVVSGLLHLISIPALLLPPQIAAFVPQLASSLDPVPQNPPLLPDRSRLPTFDFVVLPLQNPLLLDSLSRLEAFALLQPLAPVALDVVLPLLAFRVRFLLPLAYLAVVPLLPSVSLLHRRVDQFHFRFVQFRGQVPFQYQALVVVSRLGHPDPSQCPGGYDSP